LLAEDDIHPCRRRYVVVDLWNDDPGLLLQHIGPQVSRSRKAGVRGELLDELLFLEVVAKIDAPGEARGVDNIVNLQGDSPLGQLFEDRLQDLLAELLSRALGVAPLPVEIDDVGRWELAEFDVMVGDRQRVVAVLVDDQEDVFRSPSSHRWPCQGKDCHQQ
jgi:hypothetical protein